VGSNPTPSAKIPSKHLISLKCSSNWCSCVQSNAQNGCIRRVLALPIYTVALILSYLSDALGYVAAKIAGDDWPAGR
jgi:hypothetical protein